MKTLQTCLLSTALLVASSGMAQALQKAQSPNSYDCIGKNVHVTLNIGTSQGEVSILPTSTTLSLELGKKSFNFTDSEITQESTLIGDLWEVTLKAVPDLYVDHATLLVPTVLVDVAPVQFDSRFLLTRVSTPFILDTPPGVVNPSRYIPVKCSASMVYY